MIFQMKKHTLLLTLFVLGINCSAQISQKISRGFHNPIIDHTFTADPTAVEHEGRIYVYGTNDHEQYLNAEKNGYEKIKTLAMMSTDDMVNWTYHGLIPVGKLAPWIINSWAPSVVSRVEEDGKTHFYLYFSNSGYGTGVLTATSPVGPWTSPLDKSIVDAKTPGLGDCNVPFDPGVMIDDDGVGWLAFGAARSRIARLGKDMLSFDSPFINPRPQHHFEANEMNMLGGKYVYTYNLDWEDHSDWKLSDERPPRCCMGYMVSTNPLDSLSWTYGNNYMNNPGECEGTGWQYANNHTHLHKFQGQWYLFYHNLMLQDGRNMKGGFRSMCVDKIDVDEQNARISFCKASNEGVEQIKNLNPYIRQEAETAAGTEGIRFENDDSPGNMIAIAGSPFTKNDSSTETLILVRGVDFQKKAKSLSARLKGKGTLTLHIDNPDSPSVATLTSLDDEWKELKTKTSVTGVHDIYFRLTSNLNFDYWRFVK